MKEILSSIFFLTIAVVFLWGWNHWQEVSQDKQNNKPSIGALEAGVPIAAVEAVVKDIPQKVEEKKPDTSSSDALKATLDIKVLNGGAAKGSAVKVQDFLKKNGYVKTQAGSATGNYSSTVVYYLGSHEADATAVQQLLVKDYPSVSVKIATSSTAENGSAPVVVMLGK